MRNLFFSSVFFIFAIGFSPTSRALVTEVGLSHSYKKTLLDEFNFTESQSTTGSVSFYLWSRSALEFSYTQGIGLREEKITGEEDARLVRQTTEIFGLDFVFAFAGREAFLQPYIKGGVAHVDKKLRVQQGNLIDVTIAPSAEVVPSAGIGTKIRLTDTFAFNISIDSWGTQISGGGPQLDTAFRAGITWML